VQREAPVDAGQAVARPNPLQQVEGGLALAAVGLETGAREQQRVDNEVAEA